MNKVALRRNNYGLARTIGAVLFSGAVIVVAFAMSYFYSPRRWCAICPVGALQDNVARRQAQRRATAEKA
ncbi:MAG: 4Fe-4S binding protein [Rectinemataceae bacterium]